MSKLIDLKSGAGRALVRLVFLLVLISIPTAVLAPPNESYGVSDFFAYFSQARLIRERKLEAIYDVKRMQREVESDFPPVKGRLVVLVAEPPPALLFFMPLALLPKSSALILVKAFFVVCVALSVLMLSEAFKLSERQFQVTALLLTMSGPLWEALRVTKPAVLVLTGLACALWMLSRRRAGLAATGFAFWVLRPQLLVPFLLQLFAAGHLKFVCLVGACTAALSLLALTLFGAENFIRWLEVLKFADAHPILNRPDLQATLHGQLLRFFVFGPTNPSVLSLQAIKTASICAALGSMLTLAVVGYRSRSMVDSLQLAVLGLPMALVTAYYCHNYDLLLLLPAVLAFVKLDWFEQLSRAWRIRCLLLLALCILPFELPFYVIIHYWFLQRGLLISPFFLSLTALSALFLVAALGAIARRQRLNVCSDRQ